MKAIARYGLSRLVGLGMILACHAACYADPDGTPHRAGASILTQNECNNDWHLSETTGQIVYVANDSKKTPKISFARAALDHLKFKIETDGKLYQVASGASIVEGNWNSPDTPTLELTVIGDNPQLLVNGVEVPSMKGKWVALAVKNSDPEVVLSFPHATFVNLVLDHEAPASAQGQSTSGRSLTRETSQAQGPVRAEAVPPADRVVMLEQVKKAVFEVRVGTAGSSQPSATATAWFVGKDGMAVTNFHVVHGADSLTGAFGAANQTEFPLEVWAVRPEWDLAIIKAKQGTQGARAIVVTPGLPVAKADPKPGQDVWAVGFPLGMDYTVTHGTVNAVRTFDQLTSLMRSASKATKIGDGADSKWIQTDCTINPGNSGGPLVNESGEVVGINTWKWLDGANVFFALSASHVNTLLSEIGSVPLSFAVLKARYKDVAVKRTAFPTITVAQSGKIQDAIARSLAMSSSGVCSACKGTGHVSVNVIVGYDNAGGFRTPRFEQQAQGCNACSRTGYRLTALKNNALGFVQALSIADPVELGDAAKIQSIVDHVLKTATANPAAFQDVLGADFAKDIGKEHLRLGAPYIAIGRFSADLRIPGQDRIKGVYMGRTEVLLSNVLVNEAQKGNPVVFGGLFAGYVDSPTGEVVPVLQNGFVISY